MTRTISPTHRFVSIAPMMDWTDRHFRYLVRLLSQNVLLYTEMVVTGAILYGDRDRFLKFNSEEHPVAVQLGGSNAQELAQCAQICQEYGYDEVNLNVGCPSDRVQSGRFGACLMAEANTVADAIAAMKAKVNIPVTVKTRLGIDHHDSYEFLYEFIDKIAAAGCEHFIIHARKAWLSGLSPKENRTIPPLNYDRVYQLKQDFPNLHISINGGIQTISAIKEHLNDVDGTMLGREIYKNTYILTDIERHIFNSHIAPLAREEVMQHYLAYAARQAEQGIPLSFMKKHLMGLFHGQPNARNIRQQLCQN